MSDDITGWNAYGPAMEANDEQAQRRMMMAERLMQPQPLPFPQGGGNYVPMARDADPRPTATPDYSQLAIAAGKALAEWGSG